MTGGVTPAAFGADWLTTLLDQNSFSWVSSPFGARLEAVAVDWLKELFELPAEWGGVLTTGATMANFTGLAVARRWWAEQHGIDVDAAGFSGLPPAPVFSSGYIHSSAIKALGMLGLGRETVRTFARDEVGRLDRDGLEEALKGLDGAPAILIGNAGDVNAGDFDPIDELADLAERYGAWLHVDGAFGLFARLTPRARRACRRRRARPLGDRRRPQVAERALRLRLRLRARRPRARADLWHGRGLPPVR